MRVGIDIDGTITKLPEFYSILTKGLLLSGHEVHIISYRKLDLYPYTRQQLKTWGIQYTYLRLSDQTTPAPEWKAKIVKENELNLFIDNDTDVLASLGEKVVKLCSVT